MARSHDASKLLIRHRHRSNSLSGHFTCSRGKMKTISQQPEYYHGWPTLVRRKNGQLIVAYSGGREDHVCPFGRVEIIRSSDNGETWSWPEIVMDSPRRS